MPTLAALLRPGHQRRLPRAVDGQKAVSDDAR
jgi:hypothetical protein